MAEDGSVADRLAIRERLEAYADAVFRHDPEAWGACWAEDALWDLGRGEVRGRAAIVTAWTAAMAGFRFAIFPITVGPIRVDGDLAEARSFVQEHLFPVEGAPWRTVGQYDDVLVREGGQWRFQSRRYTVLHRLEG